MNDVPFEHSTAPFFAFQKPQGSQVILLPDIDALINDFYQHRPIDTCDYANKINRAVFFGATTGDNHTIDSVRWLTSQRLRSGVYFKNRPEVDFRLPFIVQCDSAETENAIRELGFGTGAGTWEEHLGYKFLLSMDGNGATCSRVAIALKSKAVLVKYASSHQLYYFSGLIPYLHYIPVSDDREVIAIVKVEQENPGHYERIALNGSQFFDDFLTAAPAMRYTAKLLDMYFRLFGGAGVSAGANQGFYAERLPDRGAEPAGIVVVHVQNHGDLVYKIGEWAGKKSSGLAVEGFTIILAGALNDVAVEYRIIAGSGESDWLQAGEFAGSRGRQQALSGFAMRVNNAAARKYGLLYYGAFIDGAVIGPCSDGEACLSAAGVPLEAIRLDIVAV